MAMNERREAAAEWTPGPWDYVPSTEHHGPYITTEYGSTIADFYTMSDPSSLSVRNGGTSKPIHHMHEMADANARMAAAAPEMFEALSALDASWTETFTDGPEGSGEWLGGFGRLSDETRELWRSIRAALAKAGAPSPDGEG